MSGKEKWYALITPKDYGFVCSLSFCKYNPYEVHDNITTLMIANDTHQRPHIVWEWGKTGIFPILFAIKIVISLLKLLTNILRDQSHSIVYMSIVKDCIAFA